MVKIVQITEVFLNRVVRLQQFISNSLLLFMMTIVTVDVIGRNFFNQPLKGTFEMTELSAGILVFFALAMTHRYREHISIDFIVEKLSKRTKLVLDGAIEFVISITLIVMATHMFKNAVRVMHRKMTTIDLHIVIYPFLYVASFAIVIFALVALLNAIKYWLAAVNDL
ncbi:MAG TPA: TRAP transporter small permease [Bacillota bacterium]